MRLATYRYQCTFIDPKDPNATHLGFIVEDQPKSLAVARGCDRVDMYGDAIMAVATMQVQEDDASAGEGDRAAEARPRQGESELRSKGALGGAPATTTKASPALTCGVIGAWCRRIYCISEDRGKPIVHRVAPSRRFRLRRRGGGISPGPRVFWEDDRRFRRRWRRLGH